MAVLRNLQFVTGIGYDTETASTSGCGPSQPGVQRDQVQAPRTPLPFPVRAGAWNTSQLERSPSLSLVYVAGHVGIFLLQNQPQQQSPVGVPPKARVQIISLTVTHIQC